MSNNKKPKKKIEEIRKMDLSNLSEMKDVLPKVYRTPGEVVRAFRKNFGFTIAEIGQLTGIGDTNLSAIENDSKELGVHRAQLLAAVFGINPAHILFPNGRSQEPELERVAQKAQELRQKKVAPG
jgi:transcriptional regulator with XRE-family HTH domain